MPNEPLAKESPLAAVELMMVHAYMIMSERKNDVVIKDSVSRG